MKENRITQKSNKIHEPNHSDLERVEEPILEAPGVERARVTAPACIYGSMSGSKFEEVKDIVSKFLNKYVEHGGEESFISMVGGATSRDSSYASFGLEGHRMSRRRTVGG